MLRTSAPRSALPLKGIDKDVADLFPCAEESLLRLHRAGWSVNCTEFLSTTGSIWIVSGYNGENQVLTASSTQAEAWWHACLQARSVGMLGRDVREVEIEFD
jgi:hypothetical protein